MGHGVSARIVVDMAEALALWSKVPDRFIHGVAQTREWIATWHDNVNRDCLVAALFHQDQLVLAIPLEVVSKAGLRRARFPGGTHANCNFPLFAFHDCPPLTPDVFKDLLDALRKARPDIDALSLTRQQHSLNGYANPLMLLGVSENPNPELSASLEGGFDAVLERGNSKRKRKKHRQHARRYAEAGGVEIITAETPQQTSRMLEIFFAMKAQRFRRDGIEDVFADRRVRSFFHALFSDAAGQTPRRLELKALQVSGIMRAVMGKTFLGNSLTVEFAGIAEDDVSSFSPGEFLFYEDINQSCLEGLDVYSFGIGDEPYKRQWCNLQASLFDTVIGLSNKGRIYAGLYRLRNRIACRIKGNPRLWALTKGLRSRIVGRKPARDI